MNAQLSVTLGNASHLDIKKYMYIMDVGDYFLIDSMICHETNTPGN